MQENYDSGLIPSSDISEYINMANGFPILTQEEEYRCAIAWRTHEDTSAAQKLVTSHLRLVVKIAMNFRGYNLAIRDLVSEGSMGLMHAVKKFDPERGFRFATYAMWWIKSSIQEFIIKNWSIVKVSTTSSKRKLFFSLNKLKRMIVSSSDSNLSSQDAKLIANEIGATEEEVHTMDNHLHNRDTSIDAYEMSISDSSIDNNVEENSIVNVDNDLKRSRLLDAMNKLSKRERTILEYRFMSEDALTLETISTKLGISRERVRQIQNSAMSKLKKCLMITI